jgi:hypothetical protein
MATFVPLRSNEFNGTSAVALLALGIDVITSSSSKQVAKAVLRPRIDFLGEHIYIRAEFERDAFNEPVLSNN